MAGQIRVGARPVTKGSAGGRSPTKFFVPPGKCVGHSVKNLGPSQKTLCPTWCPKLVTGLVGAYIPSMREDVGYSLSVVKQLKVLGCWPGWKALTVRRCWTLHPQLTCCLLKSPLHRLQTGVWESRDSRWCVSQGWRLLELNDVISCEIYTHNHSVSDYFRDWSTIVHFKWSWKNVTRPCFLHRTDPASKKLRITSLVR